MEAGLMIGDEPVAVSPQRQFENMMREVEAAQSAGFTYFLLGQRFLFSGGTRWLQPTPTLARLAAEVEPHIRLATQIIVSPLYHPVLLAEELATLDIVTEGRLVVGVSFGYVRDEYDTFGIPFDERIPRFEEGIEGLRALWTNDVVDVEGAFYTIRNGVVQTRPVQSPHPLIWVGRQIAGRSPPRGATWRRLGDHATDAVS